MIRVSGSPHVKGFEMVKPEDKTVRIRYAEDGVAIPDCLAEALIEHIPNIMKDNRGPYRVSTENVILAARVLRKEGKIPALVLYVGDQEFIVDDLGCTEGYPMGLTNDLLTRLLAE